MASDLEFLSIEQMQTMMNMAMNAPETTSTQDTPVDPGLQKLYQMQQMRDQLIEIYNGDTLDGPPLFMLGHCLGIVCAYFAPWHHVCLFFIPLLCCAVFAHCLNFVLCCKLLASF